MQTLQFQIQDDVYADIVESGIDIQTKFKEFIHHLTDDGYPSISTEEASQRVSQAVDRYRNGTGTHSPFDHDFKNEMHSYIENL